MAKSGIRVSLGGAAYLRLYIRAGPCGGMADAIDSKSIAARHGGSTPSTGTTNAFHRCSLHPISPLFSGTSGQLLHHRSPPCPVTMSIGEYRIASRNPAHTRSYTHALGTRS